MLKARVKTAVIGLGLFLPLLIFSPQWVFRVILSFFAAVSTYEISVMLIPALQRKIMPAHRPIPSSRRWYLLTVVSTLTLLFLLLFSNGTELNGIVLGFLIILGFGVFFSPSVDEAIIRITGIVLSVCYGALPWISIWQLYVLGDHARYVLLLLSVVMGCDTGAYFAGRFLGKTPLAPKLSPKKTWEGVGGGLVVSLLVAFIIDACFGGALAPTWVLIPLALIGAAASIIGDLVESAFKRFAGVKDSGVLFPGHGGLLDRADSVIFAAPTILFILNLHVV